MSQQRLIKQIPEAHGSTYQIWAEIIPCSIPQDTVCLRFSTQWTGARDPEARQIKGEYFLDSSARSQLMDLLQQVDAQ